MDLAATVLIPTHDHGALLEYSLASARAQTMEDIEILVVGDGVGDDTREVVDRVAASDPRVRFFDNPKGPRFGEAYRHGVLQEARGEFIAYLSDDDLWLPEHLEQMRGLLEHADFANALPVWFDTDGRPNVHRVDLTLPFYRELFLSGENRVPLSCAAHTAELYQRLPHGWRTTPWTTPDGVYLPTDLYMFQQILEVPGVRAVSGFRPTVLNFPSRLRKEMDPADRLQELVDWAGRIQDPVGLTEYTLSVLEDATRRLAAGEEDQVAGRAYRETRSDREAEVSALRAEVSALRSSRSWTLTAPLRHIGRLLRGDR
jgi:hypothetical protein